MPFTPSHVAAVLPLLRSPLPASALVVGSVAPDVPYYLPGAPAWQTHTATAVVTTDVAIGLVVWVGWHALLSPAVVHLAPRWVRARLEGAVVLGLVPRLGGVRTLLPVVAALVVGAATHVGWDEVTHAGRWGAVHVPALRQEWAGTEGYRWAQYASGVLGAAVTLGWVRRWRDRTPEVAVPQRPGSTTAWVVLFGAATAVGTLAAVRAEDLRAAAFTGATTGGATLLAGLVLAAIALRARGRLRR